MIRRIVVFDRPPSRGELRELDGRDVLVVLTPGALFAAAGSEISLDPDSRAGFVMVHTEDLEPRSMALGLAADLFVTSEASGFSFDHLLEPELVAGLLRRIGRRAVPLMLDGDLLEAEDLLRTGLVDGLVAEGRDTVDWLDEWIGRRSLSAVMLGAKLMRGTGGDAAERAAFAELFAEGEVAEGLRAFLQKRPPEFGSEIKRERR